MKNLPLKGTEFQVKVWKEISKIPYGETRTYKDLAIAIGKPDSARAVANACSKNPYPPSIPCLLYTSPSPRDTNPSRMPSSA